MKKIIYIILGIVVLVGLLIFISNRANEPQPEGADIEGFIFAMEENRVLVAEGLYFGIEEYDGDIDELLGNAIWFTLTEETEIVDRAGNVIEREALELQQGVQVWTTGYILESYPARAEASRMVLTGEVYEADFGDDTDEDPEDATLEE
jgi:hypothetical protein